MNTVVQLTTPHIPPTTRDTLATLPTLIRAVTGNTTVRDNDLDGADQLNSDYRVRFRDTDRLFVDRAVMEFDISGNFADTLSAASIELDLSGFSATGTANAYLYDLLQITDANSDGSVTLGDYDATTSVVLSDLDLGSLGNTTLDITAAVKAAALAADGDFTLLLKIADSTPGVAGTFNGLRYRGASLVVTPIPEPASIALLSIGGLLIGSRRRRT